MTVTETNKYLIFSCDELRADIKRQPVWYNTYEGGGARHINETSPDYHEHYREVKMNWTNFDDKLNPQFKGLLEYLWKACDKTTGPAFISLVKEEILFNLGDFLGSGIIMRFNTTGTITNRWGEEKIVCEGNDPLTPNNWELWIDDFKLEKDVRFGDKYTYEMTPALARITRQVVGDDDEKDPLKNFNFARDTFPDDLHEKPNLYLVCDKTYLIENFEMTTVLGGLTTKDGGKEVIRVVDNAAVQQIVAQDNGTVPNQNTDNTNQANSTDNQKIQAYNDQISQTLKDFQQRIFALCENTDEIIGSLIILEKDQEPEVVEKINLIFAPQVLPTPTKQKLTGDGQDQNKRTNNQTIETRNTMLIQEWENNFTKKQATNKELQKVLDQANNPDNPDPSKPNGPNQPTPPPSNKPTNPITENNQKSEENIKGIDKSASLTEARIKAQTEINSLLERYGVKAEELSSTLWESKINWENYLTTLTSSSQIGEFVKKMKMAILQQNNQNNRINQKLSIPQLQTKMIEEIKELLKKHPSVKSENLLKNQNWEAKLKSLVSQQQILNLARQLRETIVSQSNQRKNSPTDSSPDTFPAHIVVPLTLGGLAGIVIGTVFLIRRRKIRLKQKKKKKTKLENIGCIS